MAAYKHFPTWRYHREGEALLVRTQAELDGLGPGWGESPAGPFAHSDEELAAFKAKEVYETKADDIVAKVEAVSDIAKLKELAKIEEANPRVKQGRKTVLGAITARIHKLLGSDPESVPARD